MTPANLSLLCVTRADEHARPHLAHVAEIAAQLQAELVIVADGAAAAMRVLAWGVMPPPVPVVYSRGYLESVLDEAIARTHRRYVLRLDDDERCSPAMVRWLAEEGYAAADHWKFPRQHIWPEEGLGLLTPHLFPDHQTRLSVREKAGGRPAVHAGSPFGGGEEAPVAIWHDKFLKPVAERERIAASYDAFCPGYGTGSMLPFSLPERAYDEVAIAAVGDGAMPWTPSQARRLRMTPAAPLPAWPMLQHPGEIEPFLADLAASVSPLATILEIGTGPGGLTQRFCALASGCVVSVDLPSGSSSGLSRPECERRNGELARAYPHFVGVLGDSQAAQTVEDVRAALAGRPVDLLFIDGDHHLAGVQRDYALYAPFVRPGGLVAFHDIHAFDFAYDGVDVPAFWSALDNPTKQEWSVRAGWGGIGAVRR